MKQFVTVKKDNSNGHFIKVSYTCIFTHFFSWGGGPLGPKEIDGLLVSPGKAYTLQAKLIRC